VAYRSPLSRDRQSRVAGRQLRSVWSLTALASSECVKLSLTLVGLLGPAQLGSTMTALLALLGFLATLSIATGTHVHLLF